MLLSNILFCHGLHKTDFAKYPKQDSVPKKMTALLEVVFLSFVFNDDNNI
jgi:hypothetical protein